MDLLEALILGIVQGLTEFLPISSSGHLVLVPAAAGWSHPGLAFDTMLHLGTLVAVLAYFQKDWLTLAGAWLRSVGRRRIDTPDQRLAWLVLLGSVPAALAGFALNDTIEPLFSRPSDIGYFLIVTAVLLIAAERIGKRRTELVGLTVAGALFIGLFQALALAPGISRSGATIAAALLIGIARPDAARFSFLLATPVILGAGLAQLYELARQPLNGPGELAVVVGVAAAAATGYLCIAGLLRYLRRGTLYPFAAYCALVGIAAVLLI